jgi:hypothetical protein
MRTLPVVPQFPREEEESYDEEGRPRRGRRAETTEQRIITATTDDEIGVRYCCNAGFFLYMGGR